MSVKRLFGVGSLICLLGLIAPFIPKTPANFAHFLVGQRLHLIYGFVALGLLWGILRWISKRRKATPAAPQHPPISSVAQGTVVILFPGGGNQGPIYDGLMVYVEGPNGDSTYRCVSINGQLSVPASCGAKQVYSRTDLIAAGLRALSQQYSQQQGGQNYNGGGYPGGQQPYNGQR